MKRKFLSLLMVVGALVSGCGDDDDGTGPENSGRVRVAHLSPDSPEVDVLIDDVAVATNAEYLSVSDYLDVEAGSRNIGIRASGATDILVDDDVAVVDGSDYTALVVDDLDNLTLNVLTDDNTPPSAGNAKVRLIHAAEAAGLVDIYVTAPGADLEGAFPLLTAVPFGQVSDYEEVPAGDYQVRITPTGTTDVVIDTGTLTLSAGQIRTGVAVEVQGSGGTEFDALILDDLN